MRFGIFGVLLCCLSACASQTNSSAEGEGRQYILVPARDQNPISLGHPEFERMGIRSISSAYFDKGMDYKNSRFDAISFSSLLKQYPAGDADAVLLDCFDDYQGILSISDVKQYDLHLAIKIHLAAGTQSPTWLKPLLVIVPDEKDAPFQERFMTANIKGLRFVKLADYYQPLENRVEQKPQARAGLEVYRDNCLFCHSVNGVGGNKGGSLAKRFDFSNPSARETFISAFFAFHHKDNQDKQNLEQFVTRDKLEEVSVFLGSESKQ